MYNLNSVQLLDGNIIITLIATWLHNYQSIIVLDCGKTLGSGRDLGAHCGELSNHKFTKNEKSANKNPKTCHALPNGQPKAFDTKHTKTTLSH